MRLALLSLVIIGLVVAFATEPKTVQTAPLTYATVAGTVVVEQHAVPGLTVILKDMQGDTLGLAHTDDSGSFKMQNVRASDDSSRYVEIRWGANKLLSKRTLLVPQDGVKVTFRLN